MAKHVEALGSFEAFQAPWETAAGEVEIDKGRLKRYIFNLLTDKAKAQDGRDEAEAKLGSVQSELDVAKADAAKGDNAGKIASLEKSLEKETARANAAEGQILRREVGDEKGLSAAQAALLIGSTKEELVKYADQLLGAFGGAKKSDDDDEDEDDPRLVANLNNPTNHQNNAGAEPDFEKIVAGWDKSGF